MDLHLRTQFIPTNVNDAVWQQNLFHCTTKSLYNSFFPTKQTKSNKMNASCLWAQGRKMAVSTQRGRMTDRLSRQRDRALQRLFILGDTQRALTLFSAVGLSVISVYGTIGSAYCSLVLDMCACVQSNSLPPGPSVSPGKMKTPPVVVWWCRWSDPAMPALGAFGLHWEVHSLEHTHTHTPFNPTSPLQHVQSCFLTGLAVM